MNSKVTEYDVMFLHVHKQHIYEPIAGAVAAGLKTAFVTPLYNSGLTRLLFGNLPGPVGGMVRQHEDRRLDGADIRSGLLWSFARVFVNYGYRRGESRFFAAFDRWCAARIRSGKFKARIFYVFQDYLPESCAAAKEAGALLVAEQILNNSPKAQERVIESTRQVSFSVKCPEYPMDQSVNERLLGLADRVVAPSSYVRGDLAVNGDKVWQAPYGAVPGATRPNVNGACSDTAESILVAVWASSVRKGGHLLLEALLRHKAEDLFPDYAGKVEFHLLGNLDPQFLPAVAKLQASAPRVKITHGYIPHSEVAARLAQADFFLCPSLSEGMSLAMLEAAAAGLPLVITRYCGLDAFVNGTHGVLIAEASPDGVAGAIREMFLRRPRWGEFGSNARMIIEANPWSEFGRRIGAQLKSLLP